MDRRQFLEAAIIGVGGNLSGFPQITPGPSHLESGDGYLRRENGRWVMGTSTVEKTLTLEGGRLVLSSFKNKISGRDYIQDRVVSGELRLTADGEEITGNSEGWTLVRENSSRLPQGELQLDLTLRHGPLEVTKHYVIYPTTPVIREWVTISNASAKEVRLINPSFLECHLLSQDVDQLELFYMTGGSPYCGSQLLKRDQQIWPESGWAEVPPFYSKGLSYQLESISVVPQDRVRFIVRQSGANVPDPIVWNPTIVMDPAERVE
jgi:hypothetical protein